MRRIESAESFMALKTAIMPSVLYSDAGEQALGSKYTSSSLFYRLMMGCDNELTFNSQDKARALG